MILLVSLGTNAQAQSGAIKSMEMVKAPFVPGAPLAKCDQAFGPFGVLSGEALIYANLGKNASTAPVQLCTYELRSGAPQVTSSDCTSKFFGSVVPGIGKQNPTCQRRETVYPEKILKYPLNQIKILELSGGSANGVLALPSVSPALKMARVNPAFKEYGTAPLAVNKVQIFQNSAPFSEFNLQGLGQVALTPLLRGSNEYVVPFPEKMTAIQDGACAYFPALPGSTVVSGWYAFQPKSMAFSKCADPLKTSNLPTYAPLAKYNPYFQANEGSNPSYSTMGGDPHGCNDPGTGHIIPVDGTCHDLNLGASGHRCMRCIYDVATSTSTHPSYTWDNCSGVSPPSCTAPTPSPTPKIITVDTAVLDNNVISHVLDNATPTPTPQEDGCCMLVGMDSWTKSGTSLGTTYMLASPMADPSLCDWNSYHVCSLTPAGSASFTHPVCAYLTGPVCSPPPPAVAPVVTTVAAFPSTTASSTASAVLNGSMSFSGSAVMTATQVGFVYGPSSIASIPPSSIPSLWGYANVQTTSGSFSASGASPYAFSASISPLNCGSTYYYRAFAGNAMGFGYGNELSFNTPACPSAPSVAMLDSAYPQISGAASTTSVSELLELDVLSSGGASSICLSGAGFKWGTSAGTYTSSAAGTMSAYSYSGGGTLNLSSSSVTSICMASGASPVQRISPAFSFPCGTTIYYRAFATNSFGTGWSSTEKSFNQSCSAVPTPTPVAPGVVTVSSTFAYAGTSSSTPSATYTLKGHLNALSSGGYPSTNAGWFCYADSASYGGASSSAGAYAFSTCTASSSGLYNQIYSPTSGIPASGGDFTADVAVACGSSYKYQAWGQTTSGGTGRGVVNTFTPVCPTPTPIPVVVLGSSSPYATSSSTTPPTMRLFGSLTTVGGFGAVDVRILYGTGSTVTALTHELTVSGSPLSAITLNFSADTSSGDLLCGTSYNYAIKGIYSTGVAYSSVGSFSTPACPPPPSFACPTGVGASPLNAAVNASATTTNQWVEAMPSSSSSAVGSTSTAFSFPSNVVPVCDYSSSSMIANHGWVSQTECDAIATIVPGGRSRYHFGSTAPGGSDPSYCYIYSPSGGVYGWSSSTTMAAWPFAARFQMNTSPEAPISNMTQIGNGHGFSCGVDTSRDVWCWGRNDNGQLATGFSVATSGSTHALKIGGVSNVTSLAVGENSVCVVETPSAGSSTVKCWGGNASGQIGNGTFNTGNPYGFTSSIYFPYFFGDSTHSTTGTGVATPSTVSFPLTTSSEYITEVSVGGFKIPLLGGIYDSGFATACAISNLGYAYCWGDNHAAQHGVGGCTLSDGTQGTPSSGVTCSVTVNAGYGSAGTAVATPAAGTYQATTDGFVNFGVVSPQRAFKVGATSSSYYRLSKISVGGSTVCGILSAAEGSLSAGQVVCAGSDSQSILNLCMTGTSNSGNSTCSSSASYASGHYAALYPVAVDTTSTAGGSILSSATAITVSAFTACAVADHGATGSAKAYCWGSHVNEGVKKFATALKAATSGTTSAGAPSSLRPASSAAPIGGVTGVSVGYANSCVISGSSNQVACEGIDRYDTFGLGLPVAGDNYGTAGTSGGYTNKLYRYPINLNADSATTNPSFSGSIQMASTAGAGDHFCSIVPSSSGATSGYVKCSGQSNFGELGRGFADLCMITHTTCSNWSTPDKVVK